jgi:Tol biopolymer transport system component
MLLPPGTRLGAFEIVGELGAGGMGQVYRARDLKLGREVAIKILSDAVRTDLDRLARFEREARALAALNHPNVASIYGLAEQDGITALILELVEGETLAVRLQRGPQPLREAIAIARQIAQALQAAHEQGIVHRDLKPANINVTPSGIVKVLDFGLARTVKTDVSGASTVTIDHTQAGVIVGTPAYMSPEQARGQTVDTRTDVWAFGCVLFEMLTGTQPFSGPTISDSIAAILGREPDWTRLPGTTPPAVRRLLQRCLAKDAALRLRDIGEVPFALDDVPTAVPATSTLEPSTPVTVALRRGRTIALAVLVMTAVAAAGILLRPNPGTPVALDPPIQLTDFNDSALHPALSADGRMLTFLRGGTFGLSAPVAQVYVTMLPGDPKQLTHDRFQKEQPIFSPDGSRVVYTAVQDGFKWDSWQVSVLGGEPQPFLPNASGLVWLDDKRLLYSEGMGGGVHMALATSSETRGDYRQIYNPPGAAGMVHRSARSPDGKWLLLVEMDADGWLPCRLIPFDGSNNGRQVGPRDGQCTTAAWSPEGRWMYFSSNTTDGFHVWRQRFPDGMPEQITFGPTEQEGTAVSPDGKSLVTSMGTMLATLSLHGAHGEQKLTSERYVLRPSLSATGDRVFYLVRTPSARAFATGELWSVSLATGQRERVLPGQLMTNYSISANGSVLFSALENAEGRGIWLADVNRRKPPIQLIKDAEARAFFSGPDEIVFVDESGNAGRYLYRMKLDGSGRARVSPEPMVGLLAASPDGKWVVALRARSDAEGGGTQPIFVSLKGEPSIPICPATCALGFGPAQVKNPLVKWSADGRSLVVALEYFGLRTKRTVILPYRSEVPLERQYPKGLTSEADIVRNPGARVIDEQCVFPASGSDYLVWRESTASNLYRISIPR